MKLFKSTFISAALAVAFSMTGCSDWLDYTPKDKQLYEQQFTTVSGFHTTVNGIYTLLTSSSLYGYNLSYGPIEAIGLAYNVGSTNNALYQCRTASYTGEHASAILTAIWSTAYKTILNANLVLQALKDYPDVLQKDDAELIRAEMLAVRAYLHLDLTRMFGPTPNSGFTGLAVPFADTPEAIKRERLSAEVILKEHIIPDLEEAQKILKEVDPVITEGVLNTDGGSTSGNWTRYRQLRLNYYAVTLLKARAHMWMKDYDNALAEARKITDAPDIHTTFPWVVPNRLLANTINPDRGFSTECLFGYYNGGIKDIYRNNFAAGLDSDRMLDVRNDFVSKIFPVTSDYRFQSQWQADGSIKSGYSFVKYKSFDVSDTTPEFWGTFYGLLRVTEAYYIAAESAINKNDLPAATGYLNTVRNARGVPALEENLDKTNLQTEVEMEYSRELRGEGQAFFTLKRLNAGLGSYYSGYKAHLLGADDDGFEEPAKAKRYSIPIPAGENY